MWKCIELMLSSVPISNSLPFTIICYYIDQFVPKIRTHRIFAVRFALGYLRWIHKPSRLFVFLRFLHFDSGRFSNGNVIPLRLGFFFIVRLPAEWGRYSSNILVRRVQAFFNITIIRQIDRFDVWKVSIFIGWQYIME